MAARDTLCHSRDQLSGHIDLLVERLSNSSRGRRMARAECLVQVATAQPGQALNKLDGQRVVCTNGPKEAGTLGEWGRGRAQRAVPLLRPLGSSSDR